MILVAMREGPPSAVTGGHEVLDLAQRLLVVGPKARAVAALPGLPETGSTQAPIGANLAGDLAQVLAQFLDRGAAPEPIPLVNPVDHEPRVEHQGMRHHRVVVGIRVLLDVEVLLDLAP